MSSPYDDLKPELKPQPRPKMKPIPRLEEINMKSIFTSKTIWANLIGGAIAIVTAINNSDFVVQNPEVAAYFTTGMAVLNLFLRLVTKNAVSMTGK